MSETLTIHCFDKDGIRSYRIWDVRSKVYDSGDLDLETLRYELMVRKIATTALIPQLSQWSERVVNLTATGQGWGSQNHPKAAVEESWQNPGDQEQIYVQAHLEAIMATEAILAYRKHIAAGGSRNDRPIVTFPTPGSDSAPATDPTAE